MKRFLAAFALVVVLLPAGRASAQRYTLQPMYDLETSPGTVFMMETTAMPGWPARHGTVKLYQNQLRYEVVNLPDPMPDYLGEYEETAKDNDVYVHVTLTWKSEPFYTVQQTQYGPVTTWHQEVRIVNLLVFNLNGTFASLYVGNTSDVWHDTASDPGPGTSTDPLYYW